MSDSESSANPISAVRAARLLAALEAAMTAATCAVGEQRATSAGLERQRSELDAVQDSAQKLAARGRDIRNSLQVLRESLDRAKLSALNAGLEGARLGEPVGKALVVMSDEQRNLLARALDSLEQHGVLSAEVDRDRDRCLVELTRLSEAARQTDGSLGRAREQSQLTLALLHELRTDFAEISGADPEAARAMAETAAHVRTAADSLLALSERAPLGADSLRELLGPLLALIPKSQDPPR